MQPAIAAPVVLALLLAFILGFVTGQSLELGWGLPLGTSLTFFVASVGLCATLYHSYAVRRHNRLLVRPHLIFDSQFNNTSLDGNYTYQLRVKNVGLGPAIITNYAISFEGTEDLDPHTVFEEWVRLVNRCTPAEGKAHCKAGYLYRGHALDKGEEKTLLEVSFPKEGLTFMEGRELAKALVKKIDGHIDYKCHYGTQHKAEKQFSSTGDQGVLG